MTPILSFGSYTNIHTSHCVLYSS